MAVYKFQKAYGLLKGYENKPGTRGWMGPATRAALNKLASNQPIVREPENTQEPEVEIVEEVEEPVKVDPQQRAIQKIINKYNTVAEQKAALQEAFANVLKTINLTTDPETKAFLQEFKTSIQLYLNNLQ